MQRLHMSFSEIHFEVTVEVVYQKRVHRKEKKSDRFILLGNEE